jgi:hypothetical protein
MLDVDGASSRFAVLRRATCYPSYDIRYRLCFRSSFYSRCPDSITSDVAECESCLKKNGGGAAGVGFVFPSTQTYVHRTVKDGNNCAQNSLTVVEDARDDTSFLLCSICPHIITMVADEKQKRLEFSIRFTYRHRTSFTSNPSRSPEGKLASDAKAI